MDLAMVNDPKKWISVEILCAPAATEAIESAFNQLDALGTEIDTLLKKGDEPLIVSGYFVSVPQQTEIDACVTEALRIYDLPAEAVFSVSIKEVEQTDWLAEWKKHWKPTEIGKFVIAPPWQDVSADDKIVISIEPA